MAQAQTKHPVIPIERIAASIYLIRGEKVMLDSDLAELYGVTTGNLNKAVKRNLKRFPEDFMFQLTLEEYETLKFQIGIPNEGRGGRRTPPFAYTEHGTLMLANVLQNKQAIDVSINIVRTFARLRQILSTQDDVIQKLNEHDRQIARLYEHVERLLKLPEPQTTKIGYIKNKD